MAGIEIITGEMIAPCGLDCALCKRALAKENPCRGCHGPDEYKSPFCLNGCLIRKCEKLKNSKSGFCDECPDYPCVDVIEKRDRYGSAYPKAEHPIENLAYIRANGLDSFIERERELWKCTDCGGTICVHTGICSECGKAFRD